MCIVRNTENDKFEYDNLLLETAKKKLTDNKLTFDSRIKSICRKTGQKLGELLKITNCLNSNKKKAYIQWNDKIEIQLLPFDLDVLLKKKVITSSREYMKDLFEQSMVTTKVTLKSRQKKIKRFVRKK